MWTRRKSDANANLGIGKRLLELFITEPKLNAEMFVSTVARRPGCGRASLRLAAHRAHRACAP